jgi:AAT family amino acid transporter
MAGQLRPRWGQPITGIVSFIVFFAIALITWFIFSDPRGPVASFPYPFVLYLAMMILVGLWQHMFLGDWPFQNMPQPARGIVETVVNLALVWFVIHIVFYRILGIGFNFLSQSNLNELAATGKAVLPVTTEAIKQAIAASLAAGKEVLPEIKTMNLDAMKAKHFAESAVVCYVLIGFYSYPFVTILFGKWPIRPSDLPQPQAGLAEIGWCSTLTLFFYTVLIVPFWGAVFGKTLGASFGMNFPWWGDIAGMTHVHWVFGWWEWMIIVLFMTPNVWRMKPWSLIKLPQPYKGLVSFGLNVIAGYLIAWLCVKLAPAWLPADMPQVIEHAKDNMLRFLWYHAAEIAGFTLIPFLIWHHYFDDMAPMEDKDSWAAFWFRTVGVLVLCALNYVFFYYANFGHWGLGNHHMEHGVAERLLHGESLIWNFWWIIPLLWNEWFFHKWPFYVHDHH